MKTTFLPTYLIPSQLPNTDPIMTYLVREADLPIFPFRVARFGCVEMVMLDLHPLPCFLLPALIARALARLQYEP